MILSGNHYNGILTVNGFLLHEQSRLPVIQNIRSTALEAQSRKKKKKSGGGKGKSKKKNAPNLALGFGKAAGKWDGCQDLRNWLIEKGSQVDGVRVGITNAEIGLRGVAATKDYKPSDVIFSVPRSSCIIDEGRVDASPLGQALFPEKAVRDLLPPCARNALFIIWLEKQNLKGEAENWLPVLSALPTPDDFVADGGPMELWNEEEVAWVECGQLIAEVSSRAEDLRKQYENCVLPRWLAASADSSNSDLRLGDPPTLDEFRHAVCVITSRTFGDGTMEGVSSMFGKFRSRSLHAHLFNLFLIMTRSLGYAIFLSLNRML